MVEELLRLGHTVVGIDNYSKYGKLEKSYDHNKNYIFIQGDAKNTVLLKKAIKNCDYVVALAAKIGGISYFHSLAYDLLAENERIIAATFDAAIAAFQKDKLKKIVVISSSMVFESAEIFPTPESAIDTCPPPKSTYGFQKLACEYFAKGAYEQYRLPYTIVRPFNCVGIGETRAKMGTTLKSGNVKLALSHVVPDLVQKILKGQYPLHILGSGKQIRHYTYAGDIAKGICTAMFSKKALNQDFNISTDESTSVLELAKHIWKKTQQKKVFRFVSDTPFTYDVQKRIPDTTKSKKILQFEATTPLDTMLDEVIPWIEQEMKLGKL